MADPLWLYAGIFLDGPSKQKLLAIAPPAHAILSANHVTLIPKPTGVDLQPLPLGTVQDLEVTAIVATSTIQVCIVCKSYV